MNYIINKKWGEIKMEEKNKRVVYNSRGEEISYDVNNLEIFIKAGLLVKDGTTGEIKIPDLYSGYDAFSIRDMLMLAINRHTL